MTKRTTHVVVLSSMLVVLVGLVVVVFAAASVRLLAPMPATLPIVVGVSGVVSGAVLGTMAANAKSRIGLAFGLASLFGLMGGFGTALGMRLFDVLFDFAPEQRHECTVARRWEEEHTYRNRPRDVYFIALAGCESFPGDASRVELPISESRLLRVGQPAVLVTKPGALGYPYLVRVEPVDRAAGR